MRRVVVTGMGAVTPIGNTVADTWEAVKAGKCGIAPITQYDATGRKVTLAAEVKGFKPEDYMDRKEARRCDRFTQLALAAADEAMKDSGIDVSKEDTDRCGVIVSSGIGGLSTICSETEKGLNKGYERISPFFIPMSISNMAAAKVAIQNGFHGICTCVTTACAGGTNAIGEAFHNIRDGYYDVIMAGGAEACVTNMGVGGFTVMQALNSTDDPNRASIPFDKERSGFVIGEGSGMLMLEELEHAKARGAKIYGEVVGYATNCDAYHMTAPLEDGSIASKCMAAAVKDASLNPEDIDYINAHGTSTPLNDKCETRAIKIAFGNHAKKLMVSSTKSMVGHLLGASGAIEGIVCVLALKNGFVPATINYKVPDENCDLDIVPNEGRNVNIKYAMSNSLGFGGHNASIICKKYED